VTVASSRAIGRTAVAAAAQQRSAAVIRGRGGRECRGRQRRVQHVPARGPFAAHEAVGQARAEQHALAVAPVRTVGVQLVVPVRPDGREAARGRDGRDQRDAAQRQPRGRPVVDRFHVCRPPVGSLGRGAREDGADGER